MKPSSGGGRFKLLEVAEPSARGLKPDLLMDDPMRPTSRATAPCEGGAVGGSVGEQWSASLNAASTFTEGFSRMYAPEWTGEITIMKELVGRESGGRTGHGFRVPGE